MLSNELRNKLIEQIKNDPKEAIKELEKNPKLIEFLLNSDSELKKTKENMRNDRIKYINMTSHMQEQLQQQATKLQTSQGLLIGAGILFLLSLLDK